METQHYDSQNEAQPGQAVTGEENVVSEEQGVSESIDAFHFGSRLPRNRLGFQPSPLQPPKQISVEHGERRKLRNP